MEDLKNMQDTILKTINIRFYLLDEKFASPVITQQPGDPNGWNRWDGLRPRRLSAVYGDS